MSRTTIKYTCFLTIFILVLYSFLPILVNDRIRHTSAAAYSINEDDIYKGVGIAILLILVARIGQSSSSRDQEYDEVIDDYMDDIDLSEEDFDLLARVIHSESRGEPYEGQVAVGAVVLNRLNSNEFPNTLRAVIYQEMQFSVVEDGQIYLPANETAYRAARDALNGIDPSLGALFFYNPKKAKTLWWLSQRETTIIIGDHVFAL